MKHTKVIYHAKSIIKIYQINCFQLISDAYANNGAW